MTENGPTASGTERGDGFWGVVGWTFPGLGLGALVGMAFAGRSAIDAWAPWEQLGRMTFGFSALFAVGGLVLALCIGWAIEAWKRRSGGRGAVEASSAGASDAGPKTPDNDSPPEADDPTAAFLGRLFTTRIIMWVIVGVICLAMGMLGEIAGPTSRLPIGTKTGESVSPGVWGVLMVVVPVVVLGLVAQCLSEDRVRRTTQREWLRAQLQGSTAMPPKRSRSFYVSRSTPHASRACALLGAPLVCAGLAVLLIGSVDMGGTYAGSPAVYADFRVWGVVAILVGLLLLALGVVRAVRWHRQNADLRAEILERWPSKPASQRAEDAG